MKNFQVSPWFPRKPGLYWTKRAFRARERAKRNHIETANNRGYVLDLGGKALMTEIGGVGSINFRKDRDFSLITATSSGATDQGIPIICRKNVWESIEAEFKKERMIEVDLQGTLVDISQDHDSFYLKASSIPKVGIFIDSLLNIKVKTSRLDIQVSPWTIFKTNNKYQPYGFTYVHQPLFNDNADDATNWIKNYVEQHEGEAILTDFDERLNQLNAIFPLNNIVNGTILNEEVLAYSQKIHNDFKH